MSVSLGTSIMENPSMSVEASDDTFVSDSGSTSMGADLLGMSASVAVPSSLTLPSAASMLAGPSGMDEDAAPTWQCAAILLGVIATLLFNHLSDSNKHSQQRASKRNIAIISATAAAAIQAWLLVMFYSTRRSAGYWMAMAVMLLILAVFVYIAVAAGNLHY